MQDDRWSGWPHRGPQGSRRRPSWSAWWRRWGWRRRGWGGDLRFAAAGGRLICSSEQGGFCGRGDRVGNRQLRWGGQVEPHRECAMVGQLLDAGGMVVAATGEAAGDSAAAEGVVVAVAFAGAADPTVLGGVGMLVAVGVDQPMSCGKRSAAVTSASPPAGSSTCPTKPSSWAATTSAAAALESGPAAHGRSEVACVLVPRLSSAYGRFPLSSVYRRRGHRWSRRPQTANRQH